MTSDKIYVIYQNNLMYKGLPGGKCRTAYLTKSAAKGIISYDSKYLAKHNNFSTWDDFSEKQQQELISKVKKEFEIREFIWIEDK